MKKKLLLLFLPIVFMFAFSSRAFAVVADFSLDGVNVKYNTSIRLAVIERTENCTLDLEQVNDVLKKIARSLDLKFHNHMPNAVNVNDSVYAYENGIIVIVLSAKDDAIVEDGCLALLGVSELEYGTTLNPFGVAGSHLCTDVNIFAHAKEHYKPRPVTRTDLRCRF